MKRLILLALVFMALAACAPSSANVTGTVVTVIDGESVTTVGFSPGTAADLLSQAGISLAPKDRVFVDGRQVDPNQPLDETVSSLQVRRALSLTLRYDDKDELFNTSAFTVGEALSEAGYQLQNGDFIDPPPGAGISDGMTVTYRQQKPLTISVGGSEITAYSSAETVGQALASAGIPLQGLDTSLPGENEPVPPDGRIKLVRVSESVALIQKEIPYTTQFQLTAELELDQQDFLQLGEPGLNITRVRTRFEDGQEVASETEPETLVRPPQDRIIGAGTKIVVRTLDTPAGPIEYYRAVKVYATSYSPCRSGGSRCYPGTSGGLPVQRGVIGVTKSWWRYMNGDRVYVPGYGQAVISDIGGGIPGRYWIDLGFSDDDYESWHGWTTLYFLAPAPATIMYVLE